MCTPKGGTKNVLKRHREKKLSLIFLKVSLPVIFFSCFQGLFVLYISQASAPTVPPISKLLWKPSTHFPRRPKTTAAFWKKKTFHGLTIAINKWRGCTSVPEADLFKSLLLRTTGMIRKQLCLIRCNHN